MERECQDCEFWVEGVNKDTTIGRCRRYAPMAIFEYQAAQLNVDFRSTEWPITKGSDLCGDFKERPPSEIPKPIFIKG